MRKFLFMTTALAALFACICLPASVLAADDGFFIGASAGYTVLESNFSIPGDDTEISFDEGDLGYKIFGGFRWGILGVEAGYVDLGNPDGSSEGSDVKMDLNGFDLFGMLILPIGPFDIFAKLGGISWDSDLKVDGTKISSDDGFDIAAGLGAAFNLGSFGVRAELEYFDADSFDDAYMLSAGIVYTF